jgi:hypothetical protein
MFRENFNNSQGEFGHVSESEVQEEAKFEQSLGSLELEARDAFLGVDMENTRIETVLKELDKNIDGQQYEYGVQILRDTNRLKRSFREQLGQLRDWLFPQRTIEAIEKADEVLESVEPKYLSPKGVLSLTKTAEQRTKALVSGVDYGYGGEEKLSQSAYGHLQLGLSGVEQAFRMINEDEDWDKAARRVEQAASRYWREFIAGNVGGGRDTRDWMKDVTDPNTVDTQALFANMPKALRSIFHSELVQHCREKGVTSEMREWEGYVRVLEESFDFDHMVELLDATKPINDVEVLLTLDSKGNQYQGIEDSVANMAIHRAALETTGRQPYRWYIDDEEVVRDIKAEVRGQLPQFYERIYDLLKDRPIVLVQAFKGLFKISTQYKSPMGSYKSSPGYMAYSMEGNPVNQAKYKSMYVQPIGVLQASMEGHLYAISTPGEVQGLIDFCAGKIDETPEFRSILTLLHKRFHDDSKQSSSEYDVGNDPTTLFREQISIPGEQVMDRFFEVLGSRADLHLLEQYIRRSDAGVDIFAGVDAEELLKAMRSNGGEGAGEISAAFIDFVRSRIDSTDAVTAISEQARRLTEYYSVVGNKHPEVYAFIFENEQRVDELLGMLQNIAELPIEYKERVLNDFKDWSSQSSERRKQYVERLGRYDAAVGYYHDDSLNVILSEETYTDELLPMLASIGKLPLRYKERSLKAWSSRSDVDRKKYVEQLDRYHATVGYYHEKSFNFIFDNEARIDELLGMLQNIAELPFEYKKRLLNDFEDWSSQSPERRKQYVERLEGYDAAVGYYDNDFLNYIFSNENRADELLGMLQNIAELPFEYKKRVLNDFKDRGLNLNGEREKYVERLKGYHAAVGYYNDDLLNFIFSNENRADELLGILTGMLSRITDLPLEYKKRVLNDFKYWSSRSDEVRERYMERLDRYHATVGYYNDGLLNFVFSNENRADELIGMLSRIGKLPLEYQKRALSDFKGWSSQSDEEWEKYVERLKGHHAAVGYYHDDSLNVILSDETYTDELLPMLASIGKLPFKYKERSLKAWSSRSDVDRKKYVEQLDRYHATVGYYHDDSFNFIFDNESRTDELLDRLSHITELSFEYEERALNDFKDWSSRPPEEWEKYVKQLESYNAAVGYYHADSFNFIFDKENRIDELLGILSSIAELPFDYKEKVLNDFKDWSSRSDVDRKKYVEQLDRYHATVGYYHADSFNCIFDKENRIDELLGILTGMLSNIAELPFEYKEKVLNDFKYWSSRSDEERERYMERLDRYHATVGYYHDDLLNSIFRKENHADELIGMLSRISDLPLEYKERVLDDFKGWSTQSDDGREKYVERLKGYHAAVGYYHADSLNVIFSAENRADELLPMLASIGKLPLRHKVRSLNTWCSRSDEEREKYVERLDRYHATVGYCHDDSFNFIFDNENRIDELLGILFGMLSNIAELPFEYKEKVLNDFEDWSSRSNMEREKYVERLKEYHAAVGSYNDDLLSSIFRNENRVDELIGMLSRISDLPLEYKERVLNDFEDWSSRSNVEREKYVERLRGYHAAVGYYHADSFNFIFSDEARTDELLDILLETRELDKRQRSRLLDTFDTWSQYPQDKRNVYHTVLVKIAESPSQEVQRIINELSGAIIESDDPLANYQRAEDVFLKNNLPHVGKVYRVFEILYSDKKIDSMLKEKPTLSPYLQDASEKRRKYTIFSDLLRIHVETGNRSLEQYLQFLKEGEGLIAAVDSGGIESLSAQEARQFEKHLARLFTLQEQRPVSISADKYMGESMDGNLASAIDSLRGSLGVAEGQQIGERVIELFASQLGYESIDQVLNVMRRKKQEAHDRGVALARSAKNGQLAIHEGDFVKGVGEKYIGSILQNGSVAREYLGSSADSDATPFDTDVSLVLESDGKSFAEIHDATPARQYGQISFVVRDRGQFEHTSSETSKQINPSKLEVFHTGVLGDSHYGIRTGFPATEIDFMIRDEDKAQRQLEIEIAKNGYYIPIVDGNGNITFTPEQYDAMRAAFAGIERFGGPAFEYISTAESSAHYDDVEEVKHSLDENRKQVDRVSKTVRREISAVLDDLGVDLKDAYDMGLLGAELLDTGSTGRETSLPHDMDFDLVLKLDLRDQEKIRDIVAALQKKLVPQENHSHTGSGGGDLYQLRYMGADLGDAGRADIDIAFVAKNEISVYGSHDAVRDRLDWIRDNLGKKAYDDVIANILVAKKYLKLAGAYKKFEHGALGGIGVENWILANGGNFEQAARSFWKVAKGGSRSLEDFQEHYQIIDPGVNVKFMKHDNFIELLTEDGYKKMLEAIQNYFDL